MTTILSNTLADLAERVKDASRLSAVAARTSAEKALEAGRLLVEAKAECQHGEWLPFLERASVHERQARRLMQLARSGLESGHVSDLGGIKAALTFLSRWRMPAFHETMIIADPERAPGDENFGRGAAFIWEDFEDRGYFNVGIINGGKEEQCIQTRRPMRAMLECEGARPVDTIVHFLTLHFALPIDEWELRFIDREPKMTLVLAPFWTDDTLREPEGAA